VRGRDEVDVVTPHPLEIKHRVCQILVLNFFPFALVGDGPVLTENTAEVAVGEKEGAGPVVSHQGDLLPEMGMGTEDHHLGRSPAEAFLALLPVDPAPPGTELTVLKEAVSPFHPLGQFALSFEFFVGRPPGFLFLGLGRRGILREKQGTACEEGICDETATRHFHMGNSAIHPTKGWYVKATELSSGRDRPKIIIGLTFYVHSGSCEKGGLRTAGEVYLEFKPLNRSCDFPGRLAKNLLSFLISDSGTL
jgi:hypothetical protein